MKQTEGWVLFYRHISNTLVGLVANSTFNMKVALITIILASLALNNEVRAEPEPQGKKVVKLFRRFMNIFHIFTNYEIGLGRLPPPDIDLLGDIFALNDRVTPRQRQRLPKPK